MAHENVAVFPYGETQNNMEVVTTALIEMGFDISDPEVCDTAIVLLDAQGEAVFPALVPVLQKLLRRPLDALLLISLGEEQGARARAGATRGLRGLVRTLDFEYERTNIRLIEDTTSALTSVMARKVLSEMCTQEGPIICQYADQQRFEISLVDRPWPAVARRGAGPGGFGETERDALKVDSDCVVVAVGGGRGITSQCLQMLVGDRQPRIYIVGSTPSPEESYLQKFAKCGDKKTVIAQLAAELPNPAEIERAARKLLAQREVLETTSTLKQRGALVSYHQIDSTEDSAVRSFVREIVVDNNTIDVFIYGAGITIDRRFGEVTPEDVHRTTNVKAGGLNTYLSCFDEYSRAPRVVVAFGSVAASAGNPGQSAYSIANDAMEGILSKWSERHPESHTVTINWGPWARDSTHPGLVTPELDRIFTERGLNPLAPEDAARAFLTELAWSDSDVHSVTLVPDGWSVGRSSMSKERNQ